MLNFEVAPSTTPAYAPDSAKDFLNATIYFRGSNTLSKI